MDNYYDYQGWLEEQNPKPVEPLVSKYSPPKGQVDGDEFGETIIACILVTIFSSFVIAFLAHIFEYFNIFDIYSLVPQIIIFVGIFLFSSVIMVYRIIVWSSYVIKSVFNKDLRYAIHDFIFVLLMCLCLSANVFIVVKII